MKECTIIVLSMLKKIFTENSSSPQIHLLRSVLASSLSFGLDFTILFISVEIFHFYYIAGGIAGFISGTSLLYIISISWIFDYRSMSSRIREYTVFMIIGLLGGIMNILLLWFFTEFFNVFYLWSRLLAGGSVFIFNYTGRKIILFTKTKSTME